MKRGMILPLAVFLAASALQAGQIGYVEDFALAKDREAALKQLIPGTEEYYYYHVLHYQNAGDLNKAREMIAQWIRRHGHNQRNAVMENRQALLGYPQDHAGSLNFLIRRLNIQFNHEREVLGRQASLPTELNPQSISRQTLTQRALGEHGNTTDGFEDAALPWLAKLDIGPARRRHLLARMTHPAFPALPEMVLADLRHEHSGGFGSMPIHQQLLLSQLDELLKLDAGLLNNGAFVTAYLHKLQPSADLRWQNDPQARLEYLERLWTFVSRLAPVHNSLKAHVLYHRLLLDRSRGVYDKDRFMTYLKLPRIVHYMRPEYLKNYQPDQKANLNANFAPATALPPVQNDEPLVRSCFHHFFLEENAFEPYAELVHESYLKQVFAETKVLAGLGDMEKWYSMLSPEYYRQLKDRVDIDFAFTNQEQFAVDQPVKLTVHLKNVQKLLVKVYRINTENYYRSTGEEVDTGINLDGLVAADTRTHEYQQPALRRHGETFEFPAIDRNGVYVIDFIGSGKASRALVRKGTLRHLVRTSPAGHVFTIFDQANRKLNDARIVMAGQEYKPDQDGRITIPFSTNPGPQPIILVHGDFACLDQFTHQAEAYSLQAGFHVERESLLRRRKDAQVIVRPDLKVTGVPAPLALLEKVTLVIHAVDREGVPATREVHDFKLQEDKDSICVFPVSENLQSIQFTLKAEVQNVTRNRKENLSATQRFDLNNINKTDKVEDMHLMHVGGAYVLEALGKTGEARADQAVHFEIKHSEFRRTVTVSLRSDQRGRIHLGDLADIDWVKATNASGTSHAWRLIHMGHSGSGVLHGCPTDTLALPLSEPPAKLSPDAFALLELRGGTYAKDHSDALGLRGGLLTISKLPPGDYRLILKSEPRVVEVRITDGKAFEDYVLSQTRCLQTPNPAPLQIASVEQDKDSIRVHLQNATKLARVHVFATRYLSEYHPLGDLVLPAPGSAVVSLGLLESVYLAGRDIGDEYRYILDRQYATKFPGNMLSRPGLLLNPWAIHKTQTSLQDAQAGEEFSRTGGGQGGRSSFFGSGARRHGGVGEATAGFADLDFLSAPAAVLVNLAPDANGVVTIAREKLGPHQQVQVVAVDDVNTAYRELTLDEAPMEFVNLALTDNLDPRQHFIERKQITAVETDKSLAIADIATARFEAYDSVGKVYNLYLTLSNNSTLAEFGFIARWDKLKPEEKREKYSKYACHELHFFLSRKDPEFFAQVIRPYLANKKDKTFMDCYLLGQDLSEFLQPWQYGQLNVAERALLGRRIQQEQAHAARHIREMYNLLPPNVELYNHLFRTALQGSSLAAEGENKLGEALEKSSQLAAKLKTVEPKAERTIAAAPMAPPPAAKPAATRRPAEEPAAPARDEAAKEMADSKDAPADGRVMERLAEARSDRRANRAAMDLSRRKQLRQLYLAIDQTQEYAENNYYHLPIEAQNAQLIPINAFWRDYAQHQQGPFLSTNLAECGRNFPEMMLALGVIDLPFEAKEHKPQAKGISVTVQAASPMVVYHKEIKPAEPAKGATSILVSQNFFRLNDRYTHVDNERMDKFVTDEFLTHVVYGCQVVVTNPTSARQKLDLLLQVPAGAIPVNNHLVTRTVHVVLEAFSTQAMEYHFYFPRPGEFPHYPVHVSRNETLIAFAQPMTLKVVVTPTKVDTASWDYISQHGTNEQVMSYLAENNLQRTNLERIAWRMKDADFFRKVTAFLAENHAFNLTLWSYSLRHDVAALVQQYLRHRQDLVSQVGPAIASELLVLDPVERRAYQHLEYMPLVNARAHKLGEKRTILNNRLFDQYHRLMNILSCHKDLDQEDRMAVTYYLLLQDRIEEAVAFFATVDRAKVPTQVQYDYLATYIAFYTAEPAKARQIAARYADYGVDRWRSFFVNALAQLDELEGKAAAVVDKENRDQQQAQLAASQPSLDFKVESRQVVLDYQNLKAVTVNYYLMDIELLFSRNPFVQQYSDQFSFIQPNLVQQVNLPAGKTAHTFDLPKEFHSSNVMVEVCAAGIRKSQAYFANSLALQVIETYGQVRVAHQVTAKPIAKAYVKVYARMRDGQVKFYKDGYTDLRGRFEYASLSTGELANVERFSILIMTPQDGAVVREAAPPKQ